MELVKDALEELKTKVIDKQNTLEARVDEVKEQLRLIKSNKMSIGNNNPNPTFDIGTPENNDKLKDFIEGKSREIRLETKDMSLTSSYTGGVVALSSTPIGPVGSVSRFSHLRDILPIEFMSDGQLPIIRDTGTDGDFDTVEEGDTKPSLDFTLSETPAKAQVIAAIVSVTRQFLDDLGPKGVTLS